MSQIEDTTTQMIPTKEIKVKPGFNPRKDAEPSADFVAKIRAGGIQEDLHLWPIPEDELKKDGYKYYVLEGERRLRSARKLNYESVPAKVHAHVQDEVNALVYALMVGEKENLSDEEKADAVLRVLDAAADPKARAALEKEVAQFMGMSIRSLKELLAIKDSAVPAIAEATKAENPKEKIPRRAAARAAKLPEKAQEKLAKQMAGKSEKEATEIVRQEEKRMSQVRPGRKAAPKSIRSDASRTLTTIRTLILSRLEKSPGDERAKAHFEMAMVLSGEAEVVDLYPGDGKASLKIATDSVVKEAVGAQAKARQEAEERSATKAAKKKVTKKVEQAKKTVSKKKKVTKKELASKKATTVKKTVSKKAPVKKAAVSKKVSSKKPAAARVAKRSAA